jgi:uncharacterized protein YabE (DUF348 family)
MADPLKLVVKQRAGIFASIALILFLGLLGTISRPVSAAKSIVTVFADNSERSISTTVVTVREALDKAGIVLGTNDLVEPGLDTFINEAVFSINVYRARPVIVVDGEKQTTIMSPYQSPRLIAESAGYTVYDEDAYHFELIDDIVNSGTIGQRLIIDRATPVTISLYGDEITHRTHLKTVGEVLDEVGVKVGKDDEVNFAKGDRVIANRRIKVVRVGTDVITEERALPHDIEIIRDSNMFAGQEKVKTTGVDGIKIVTYELQLENGKEVSRKEIQSVTKKKPVTEVKIVGTKVPDGGSNVEIGKALASSKGWSGDQWQCLYSLWQKESHWNHLAYNPSSGATGIPQALPGSKMASAGTDWATNPATQIKWGLGYIAGRYGSPCGAWQHSVENGWY